MTDTKPVLHLVCGKIAAGKSTLASKLACQPKTVLISQDFWLATLFPDEIKAIPDFLKYSTRLRTVIGDHTTSLLQAGLSVVLDFPANTVELRQWMRQIFDNADVAHQLHFLDVPDALCKERLRQRNADGQHEFAPTQADFDLISSYFQPPMANEGFNVTIHTEEAS